MGQWAESQVLPSSEMGTLCKEEHVPGKGDNVSSAADTELENPVDTG